MAVLCTTRYGDCQEQLRGEIIMRDTCNSGSVTGFKLDNRGRVCFFICLSSVLIFPLHISQLFNTFTVHTAVNYCIHTLTLLTRKFTHFLQTAKTYHVLYGQ